jgi:hypothetical protein
MFVCRGPMRALGVRPCATPGITPQADLAVFYTSTRLWLHGQNPYDYAAMAAEFSKAGGARVGPSGESANPPCTFVLLAPLGFFSWPTARAVWLGVNLLGLVLIFRGLMRLVGADMTGTRVLLLMAFVLGLAPVQTSTSLGQTVIPVTALIVWAIVAQRSGWGLGAGVLLAIAAAIKPQMGAAYLAYFLLRGRWRVVLAGAAVGSLLLAAGVFRMELAGVQWLSALKANYFASFNGGACDLANVQTRYQLLQLQYPLFALTGIRAVASDITWVIAAIFGGLLIWFSRRIRTDRQELLALGVVTAVGLLCVYHRYYDAAIILIPAAWALALHPPRVKPYARLCVLLIAPFVLPGGPMLHDLGGHLPRWAQSSWWWQGIVLPHQTWLVLGLAAVLTAALARTLQLPRERQAATQGGSAGSLGDTNRQSY